MEPKLKIEPLTALVIVSGIAGVVVMAWLKIDPKAIAAYAAAFIGAAGAFRQLAYTKPAATVGELSVAPDGSVKVTSTQPTTTDIEVPK